MERIWIIGAGRFGLHALRVLAKGAAEREFLLVDPDGDNLARAAGPGRTLEQAEGVAFLAERLRPDGGPDWLVPALPVHLAAEWCRVTLAAEGVRRVAVPESVASRLPHPHRGDSGDVYVSHADFRCPPDCPEPPDICTVTRRPRPRNLFEVLVAVEVPPFRSLVLRSHQLGPGVGGYRPGELFDIRARVAASPGPVLLSTACRCHGVVTGLERSRPDPRSRSAAPAGSDRT